MELFNKVYKDPITAYVIRKLLTHCGNWSIASYCVPPLYPPLFKQTKKQEQNQ